MSAHLRSILAAAALIATVLLVPQSIAPAAASPLNGVVTVKSAYSVDETIARIKADVAAKGIMFFDLIDQSGLGTAAGVEGIRPSKLLIFGNPALGTTFITANPEAGLDWPVRVLVFQKADGSVHVAYNDFDYIARRHGIVSRGPQFRMATMVIRSVADAIRD
ncbi:MAG: chromosome condensation protein CrcB [Alphaproteobacteria bacterium]|nr:MAG: chromosome condensation protein CrcB [Alphaproteobacteria bacterium]